MIPVDAVTLQMDYAIIQYFSDYLYSSPNKAVEELICNGFDAWATRVDVYLDGKYGDKCVLVWDDGASMNVNGLQDLWVIAKSPKKDRRQVKNEKSQERVTIGKFGIGKLASYSLGNHMVHLCRQGEDFYLVDIDYSKIQLDLNDDTGESSVITTEVNTQQTGTVRYESPIYKLTEEEARQYTLQLFNAKPKNFEAKFGRNHWTLAIITGLKTELPSAKKLKWLLGFAMPLRPDFVVTVDEEMVESHRVKRLQAEEWDFGTTQFRASLTKLWKDNEMVGDILFGSEKGLNAEDPTAQIPYVELPNLGKVWGSARFYDQSLLRDKDMGRSHGVFLMVYGRVVNVDSDRLFLSDPSFGAFYRSQYFIYCDGVDDQLLADREKIKQVSSKAEELKTVERALYRITTDYYDTYREPSTKAQVSWLPTFSRPCFVSPVLTLLARNNVIGEFPLNDPVMEMVAGARDEPLARISSGGFKVNSAHPYIEAASKRVGSGKKGQEAMREFQKIAVSEELFHGHLLDMGLPSEQIHAILEWRDQLYRSMAQVSRSDVEQLITELDAMSYKSGKDFESAIAQVLTAMGFVCTVDGDSGKKDVLLVAPCGDEESYTFTFEAKAKASKGGLPNDSAEISGANNHRVAAKARHAVVVAREFAGFARTSDEVVAILGECESQRDPEVNHGKTPVVTIMTTDALGNLLRAVNKYKFSLDSIKHVFTVLESPEEKMATIDRLQAPMKGFDFPGLLSFLHDKQVSYKGGRVPVTTLYREGGYADNGMTREEFKRICEALEVVARPHFQMDGEDVFLRQSPEMVINLIEMRILPHPEGE